MKTINVQQGTDQWLAHRRSTRNASDASVMMGASPNVSRRDFVRMMACGLEREFSDYVQQYILDRGHAVEPALRSLAEALIEDDLYPITGVSDDGYLGASFDGVNLDETIIMEAKQPNADKSQMVQDGIIPPQDYWQIVQQFAVCSTAESCFYVVGDGTKDGTVCLEILRSKVVGDIPRLLAGWKQFDKDVANYQPEPESAPLPIGRAPEQLPALSIQVTGMVTASNLAEFKANAMEVLGSINRDLKTDEDFANADRTVKWCQGVEERLEATKQQVLGQTADIEAVFRTMDEVKAEARKIRLELDKLVTKEKENRKAEIVRAGVDAVRAHYDTLNASLDEHRIQPPQSLTMDIGATIKGKKSLSSMKDAVDAAAANFKIAASEQAERVRANMRVLDMEVGTWAQLFPDRVTLCATKAPEDLRNLIVMRIQEAKDAEERRQAEQRRKDEEQTLTAAQEEPQKAPPADTTAPALTSVPPSSVPARSIGSATSQAKIKLGDINARLAPITITADGLAKIGIQPAAKQGGATLYRESDFPQICHSLAKVLEQAVQKKVA